MNRSPAVAVIVALVAALATPCCPVKAQGAETVRSLYQACRPETVSGPKFFCLGYIAGIGDAMQANGLLRHPGTDVVSAWQSATSFCPIGVVTTGAMVQAFVNWAGRHPEQWADKGLFGVATALRETWPCR